MSDNVVLELEFKSAPPEKKSWWEDLPIISMFLRYKNNEQVMKDNGIKVLPERESDYES